jgi:hypothetical protein
MFRSTLPTLLDCILPPCKIVSFPAASIETENGGYHDGRLPPLPMYKTMETLPSLPINTGYASPLLAL